MATTAAQRQTKYRMRHKFEPKFKERKKEQDHNYLQANQARRMKYKGRHYIIAKQRIGVCNLCRSVKGTDCKQTQWHHVKYDDEHKEQHIIELCASCHRRLTTNEMDKEILRESGRRLNRLLTTEQRSSAGRNGMLKQINELGKKEYLRRADKARKWVYNRWTGKLVKRRTFTNV